MVFSTVEADSPSLKMFSGINGYALTDKAVISFGRDPLSGKIFFRLGATGATQYLEYTQDSGLTVAETISTQSVFDDGQGNRRGVAEYVEKVAGGVFGTLATRNIALQSGEWGLEDCTFEKFSGVGLAKWNTWMEPCGLSFVGGGLRIERTGELTHGATEQLSVSDLAAGQVVTLRLKAKVEGLTGEPSAVVVELLNLDQENLHYAVWFAQITENGDVDLTRTMKVGARMKDARLMFNMAYADIGASITIKEVGLYLGDRIPELWEAAPEDTGYLRKALREAVADSTELTGGMVLSTMLLLGTTDADGVRDIQSGLSGVNTARGGSAPAVWMGGNPFGGVEPTALLRHNGLGYFGGGVIQLLKDAIAVGGRVVLDGRGLHMLDSEGREVLTIADVPIDIDGLTQTGEVKSSKAVLGWGYMNQWRPSERWGPHDASKWTATTVFSNGTPTVNTDAGTLDLEISVMLEPYNSGSVGTICWDADVEWLFTVNYADGTTEALTASEVVDISRTRTHTYKFRLRPGAGKVVNSVTVEMDNATTRLPDNTTGLVQLTCNYEYRAKSTVTYAHEDTNLLGNNGFLSCFGGAMVACAGGKALLTAKNAAGSDYGLAVTPDGFRYKTPTSSDWKAWDPAT